MCLFVWFPSKRNRASHFSPTHPSSPSSVPASFTIRYMLVLEALDDVASDEVHSFAECCKQLYDLGQVQESNTHQYMIDPLKRFCKIFPATAKSFADQKVAGQALRKAKEKVTKLKGKPADAEKLAKAERASEEAAVADHEAHELATKDVSAVVELRTAYVQPCLLALLQSAIMYLEQVEAAIESAQTGTSTIDEDATAGVAVPEEEDAYRVQTKGLLDDFNQLSIVGSTK